jgi:hypothetical protein
MMYQIHDPETDEWAILCESCFDSTSDKAISRCSVKEITADDKGMTIVCDGGCETKEYTTADLHDEHLERKADEAREESFNDAPSPGSVSQES